MPYRSRKVRGKNCYRVFNGKTKKVFAKCATQKNAIKQMRLLRAIENNPSFVAVGRRRGTQRRRRRVSNKKIQK